MSPVEDRGCGPRPDRGPVWLGREGPGNGSSQKCNRAHEETVFTEPFTPSKRPKARDSGSGASGGVGSKITRCGFGVGLVLGLPGSGPLDGSPFGSRAPASHPSDPPSARRTQRRPGGFDSQACNSTHVPPLVCHASSGVRFRHPDGPRVVGPQGCFRHDDLHPCLKQTRDCSTQSRRHPLSTGAVQTAGSRVSGSPAGRLCPAVLLPVQCLEGCPSPHRMRAPWIPAVSPCSRVV